MATTLDVREPLTTGPGLKELRDHFDLTQDDVAREMRVARQRVSTIEGMAEVPISAARRYAVALFEAVKAKAAPES